MGKGSKKTAKLVKPEKQEKPKKDEPSAPQPLPPSFPSPIPEEVESGFAAQSSVHGDDQPLDSAAFTGDSWGVSAHPAGTWLPSGNPNQVASPSLGDRKLSATPGPSSRVVSWAEQSTSGSYDQQHNYYPPSPHPGMAGNVGSDPASVDFERNFPRSNDESDLDYVSEGHSGMGPNSNVRQHWDSAAQLQPQPQLQPGQPRPPAPPSGPSFPVYATSLSNPPLAPNPLPAAPNVVSRASEAAARLDKSKKGDVPPLTPPQPPYVPPPISAAWLSWLKPDVYKPSFEQPGPPTEALPAPHVAVTASVHSGRPISMPKGSSSNPPRGVWEIRHSNQPNGGAQSVGVGAGGAWNQLRSSADGWAGYQGKGGYDEWNEGGRGRGHANNGGWNEGGRGRGQANNGGWNEGGRGRGHANNGGWNEGGGGRGQANIGGWNEGGGGRGQVNIGGWNEGGGGRGQANIGGWSEGGRGREQANNGGWFEGGKKHDGSKSAGTWGGKRNVQWEEETDEEETDETDDDGWGEEDGDGDWEQINGGGKSDNRFGNAEGAWGGSGGTARANDWAASGPGWGQVGWGQEVGASGVQQTGMHSLGDGKKGHNASLVATGIKAAVSPQQRTQILNSLLNMTDQKQAGNVTHKRSDKPMSKKIMRENENKRQTLYNAGWGLEDEWGNVQEDENVKGDRTRSSSSKRTSTAWGAWGGNQDASRYSMPSLTLAYAYRDSKTRLDPVSQNKPIDVARMRFHESKGTALLPVQNAFFSKTRLARDRLHWSFPPDKDERVRAALTWIQDMSYELGTFGLHKFLQHRERGALVINAGHKLPEKPNDFAVDYLIFDYLQKSYDKTLQSSVISYDPAVQVIVFVFLPSKSGNSIAIWRRKLAVPNNTRLRFQNELEIALGGLKDPKEYIVHVDETPKEKKIMPKDGEKSKKKRKWWQIFKSKS